MCHFDGGPMGQDEAMACIQTPHAREWARPESGVQFLPPFFLVGPMEPVEAIVREANEAVGWTGEAARGFNNEVMATGI